MTVKFMYNGIKIDGVLYKAMFSNSLGGYHNENGIVKGTITMYAKDYKAIPRIPGLQFENNTELVSDYIETDIIRIAPDNQYYSDAMAAYKKSIQKDIETMEKRIAIKGSSKDARWNRNQNEYLQDYKNNLAKLSA